MDIYIYFNNENELDLDELEEKIEDFLENDGEVTGRGIGTSGCNIDVELYNNGRIEAFIVELQKMAFPQETYLVVNGVKRKLT